MKARPAAGAVWPRFALAIACGGAALVCGVGFLVASAWLVRRAADRPPLVELTVAIAAVQAFGLGRCLFGHAERHSAHDAALRLLTSARVRLYERLTALTPAGPHGWRYGRLLRLLVGAAEGAAGRRLTAMVPMGAGAFAGMAAVGAEWWLLPPAGAVLLAALLMGGLAAPLAEHRLAVRAERRTAASRTELSTRTLETLRALPELLACGVARQRLHVLRHADADLTEAEVRSAWTAGIGSGATTLTGGAAVLGALLTGVPAVRAGRLDGVLLAVVVLIPLAGVEIVAVLSAAARQALRRRGDAALLRAVLDAPVPATGPAGPRPVPALEASVTAAGRAEHDGPRGYALSLRRVRAGWPGTDGETLRGLDLELPQGRRVAVVREDGGDAGRSTLAAVLLRLVDYEGSVTLNGVELRDLAGDDVRAVVGLCARDAHVFDATVAENIRIGRPGATDAEVTEALRRAGLAAWSATLPDGLDTRLGAHGAAVPGGTRLRIALARALLADVPVLIVDEPEPGSWPDPAIPAIPGGPSTAIAGSGAVSSGVVDSGSVLPELLAATAGRTVLLVTRRRRTPGADAVLRCVDEVITVGGGGGVSAW
ncbi:MAG TPA: thiol reductant ABC exporter subunit CydC [Actinomadura sp.]|nr:thiol reductant ABC exporter subunit CydC [Actinomadura sp.]